MLTTQFVLLLVVLIALISVVAADFSCFFGDSICKSITCRNCAVAACINGNCVCTMSPTHTRASARGVLLRSDGCRSNGSEEQPHCELRPFPDFLSFLNFGNFCQQNRMQFSSKLLLLLAFLFVSLNAAVQAESCADRCQSKCINVNQCRSGGCAEDGVHCYCRDCPARE
ncbi:unnamed protein product [Caenorhabditis auriculariae]|uniref:Uncharacterized protein n=1 Tax=Caenorhabditis auriculariae TaxID=2777116 RepID=A0A8S1GTJ6_9PELO|nr:unnamed protein product [Caenorhabditis auriculariae]